MYAPMNDSTAAAPAAPPERSKFSKVLEVSLVMCAVLGFIFAGKWGKDALAESNRARSYRCPTC